VADQRRVVITGIGAVTPIGITRDALWDGLKRARSAVRSITRFDPGLFRSRIAAEIDFKASDFLEAKQVRKLDRFGHFTVTCARLAVADSEIDMAVEDRERVGSMMGSALGGIGYAEEQFLAFKNEGVKAVSTTLATNVFAGAASCNVAIELGAQGPNSTNAMSCASGTMAIGEGFRQIRDNYADVMICGASEAPLNQLCFGAFAIIRAMSTRNEAPSLASRPFDRGRDGFVMAEGGAVLVLESAAHAARRGARAYARIAGHAATSEAYNVVTPRPLGEGMAATMRLALQDARIGPAAIGYVSAHGTSTRLNDLNETAAIKTVFGAHAGRLPVSAVKSMLGHAIGASSAVQIGILALSLYHRIATPTINYDEPDPECDLDYVPNVARDLDATAAISNAFAFGGHNCSVVLVR
jgi:3-oxoacyl-[acyl-carrier-protein] synthase II